MPSFRQLSQAALRAGRLAYLGLLSAAAHAGEAVPCACFANGPKGLEQHFTAWRVNYVGEVLGNLSGGLKRGATYDGYLQIGLGVNFAKVAGWDDTVFYASFLYPHGEGLTQNYVGDLNVVSNIDAYDSPRLFDGWMEKEFLDRRLSVRLGVMAIDSEFFASSGASLFLNSGFGAFPVIGQDLVAPIYPVTAPGLRVRWQADPALTLSAAVFSGDAGAPTVNRHNTEWRLGKRNGVTAFVEAAYQLHANGKGLPGTYKMGGFYDSKCVDDLSGGGRHHGNYGGYAIADQMVWREGADGDAAKQGLGVFARFALAPQDRSFVSFDAEAGLTYTGLLPSRDNDVAGLGVVYARVSGEARDAAGQAYPTHQETVVEFSYQATLGDHLTLQPDFQYVFHPGAVRNGRDAVVAGLRCSVGF